MKTFMKLLLVSASVAALAACSTVPPGNVGVKVYGLGGPKGVDAEALPVGQYWLGWNESLYLFPTFMQNYTWTEAQNESFVFQTVEGLKVQADIGISYQIIPSKVVTIFQTYRKGVDEITNIFLRNMVRDALVKEVSTRDVEYVYGRGKAELMDAIQKDVQSQVLDIGIQIDKIYWIGDIKLPDTVVASINAKNAATQMAQQRQNEVAQAQAEAQKKVAEATGEAESVTVKAKAQADANKILAESLTPELIQYKAIDAWNGQLPQVSGSGAVPFINLALTNTNKLIPAPTDAPSSAPVN